MKAELDIYKNEDDCCACGNNVPEGRQVCPTCESKVGDCPCRHCVPPKRTYTCHITCKEYKDWSEAKRIRKCRQNKKERANSIIRQTLIDRSIKSHQKRQKMKRK